MGWWGKLIGGAFGYLMGGVIGALLGAALGHKFDKGLSSTEQDAESLRPDQQSRIQLAFFTATFSVLGAVAKADGRINPEEIAMAERVMAEMDLTPEKRHLAIDLFNQGKAANFALYEVLDEFRRECSRRQNLLRIFLEIQVEAAFADGTLHSAELSLLLSICRRLGLPEDLFWQLLQHHKNRHRQSTETGSDSAHLSMDSAYTLLGIKASATDAEIKNAYRRLMSQHHPDKLVAKGLPEEMMKIAEQKTVEIKKAYEFIKERRGLRS